MPMIRLEPYHYKNMVLRLCAMEPNDDVVESGSGIVTDDGYGSDGRGPDGLL